jgi:murein DD-endopeptidase MepM/ murein hydrolase activator NlpD
LPDPRALYRHLTASNLPTRVVAHLSVVALVAIASLTGFTQTQGGTGETTTADTAFPMLVSSVRGAADSVEPSAPSIYDINPLLEEETALDRGTRAVVPDLAGPMPTPAPIDPNATPLPGPTTAAAGSTTSTAPTSRTASAPVATGALRWPVPGGSISQYFHAGHLALDIAAPYGTQVVASQAGTVTWAGWRNNGGGYVISINHGNGIQTVYNHLASIWVSPGQYVAAGQGIAGVGCTGICTGPHVHFEVIVNGIIDNPLRYL